MRAVAVALLKRESCRRAPPAPLRRAPAGIVRVHEARVARRQGRRHGVLAARRRPRGGHRRLVPPQHQLHAPDLRQRPAPGGDDRRGDARHLLRMPAAAPRAVARARRRASLAAMQPADGAPAHGRLPAGATIGFAPGAATRRQAQLPAPVAGRPHFGPGSTGHEVGCGFSRFPTPAALRRRAQGGKVERRRQAGALDAVEVGEMDGHGASI